MIQIGWLTTFVTNEGDEKVFFKVLKGLAYPTLKDCFDNVDKDLGQRIKDTDRVNMFYTVAHHLEGKRKFKTWQAQDIIPFDLDGIDLERIDEYPKLLAEVLDIDLDKCAIVHTGNGCHVLVQVKLWSDKDFIKKARLGYRQLLDRMVAACEEKGLPIDRDTTAWDYGRILRLPFTTNFKEGKGEKQAVLKYNGLEEQTLEVPILEKPRDGLSLEGTFPKADIKEITNECRFFQWLRAKPEEVHEPHAYAMLSIAGHFDDDASYARELWDTFNSPSINSKDFGEFTEQALTASGPRTCKGIEEIYDGCKTCPHYNKVKSPILLKGKDFIGTEHLGFTLIGPKGGKTRQYEDLRKFYSKETSYIHLTSIKRVMIYKDGLFKKTNDDEIKGFAQAHFKPTVESEEERKQFLYQVKAYPDAQKGLGYIHGARNEGLINLKNGVYDLKNRSLLEHSPDYGFLYKLPYDFNPNTQCPTWLELLNNLTCNRPELIDLIEEAIAYTIGNVPYTKYQHYFLLTGGGSNGKTTFINIFKMLLGSENTASIKLANLLSKEYYVAELEGKLANMVADEDAEAFERKGADSTLLKALTGGDSVTARVIYEGPMQFINRAKFFYAFNNIPRIGIKSHGDIRRPIIIPFDANLDKSPELKIENLYEKIEGELSGILNRVAIAYERLMINGFTKSSLTYDKIKESRVEHDAVYDFLNSEVTVDAAGFASYTDLYDIFDSDSMYQHDQYKTSKRVFCKRVRQIIDSDERYKGCDYSKQRSGGVKGIEGLRVVKSTRATRF